MSAAPRVSIVIPFYNCADRLGSTLARVYAQTCADFEVIIVDDGSADAQARQLRQLATRYSFSTLRQLNAGPAAARNTGLRAATAPLVAFLDADDLWETDKLERQLAAFDADPDVTLCVHDSQTVEASGRVLSRNGFSAMALDPKEFAAAVLNNRVHSITSAMTFRKSAATSVGGMNANLRFREDHAFLIDLIMQGKLTRLSRTLSSRVIHGASYSHASNSDYIARKRYWDEQFFTHVGKYFDRRVMARARAAALEHTAVNDVIMGKRGRAAWSMLQALVRGEAGLRPLKVLLAAGASVFRPGLLDGKDPALAQRRES